MTQPEAKALGAMALFGEKYGDQVRVVSVGDWAHELCGGTHVKQSGELGIVKLLSESSVGAGVRRVEALVGIDAYSFLAREHVLLNSITHLIKGSRPEELPEKISELLERMKASEKELSQFKTQKTLATVLSRINEVNKFGDINYFGIEVEAGASGDDLRVIAGELKNRIDNSVIVLISKGADRATLVAASSKAAISKGIKAGEIVKLGSTILGGGGGGKDDFAQGGGSNQEAIRETLLNIEKTVGQLAGK